MDSEIALSSDLPSQFPRPSQAVGGPWIASSNIGSQVCSGHVDLWEMGSIEYLWLLMSRHTVASNLKRWLTHPAFTDHWEGSVEKELFLANICPCEVWHVNIFVLGSVMENGRTSVSEIISMWWVYMTFKALHIPGTVRLDVLVKQR